jgi:hypothetical protein
VVDDKAKHDADEARRKAEEAAQMVFGSGGRGTQSITWAGLIIIYVSVAAFFAAGYLLYRASKNFAAFSAVARGRAHAADILSLYAPEFILSGIGIFTALLGVKLVRAGGLSPSDPLPVVNPTEWRILAAAIVDNKDDPIGQYIRLSSLTGATGLFTKLGLSGLPLATIGLTLFFAVISMIAPRDLHFYELTQLTLGAFIGSFVQKQVGALRENGKPVGSGIGTGSGTGTGTGDGADASSPPKTSAAAVDAPKR